MTTRLQFPLTIPFVEQLGLELHRFDNGHAEVQVDLEAAHLNSWEVAHGGVLMTLLDVAMAHAARSVHAKEPGNGPGLVTIEMKTSFMRPAEGRLRFCHARSLATIQTALARLEPVLSRLAASDPTPEVQRR